MKNSSEWHPIGSLFYEHRGGYTGLGSDNPNGEKPRRIFYPPPKPQPLPDGEWMRLANKPGP